MFSVRNTNKAYDTSKFIESYRKLNSNQIIAATAVIRRLYRRGRHAQYSQNGATRGKALLRKSFVCTFLPAISSSYLVMNFNDV